MLGASGYAGRELCRLIERHPRVSLAVATARAGGQTLRLGGGASIPLQALDDTRLEDCDVVFSCLPHGTSAAHLERAPSGALVVDLSADLRPGGGAGASASVTRAAYGLTELDRAGIRAARVIANPGCYPTGALLGLAPVLRRGLVGGPIVIHAASGVTGAGRSPRADLLFGEVAEDFRPYAAGNEHRHLAEMQATARALAGAPVDLVFTPHLLPIRRGILETIHVPLREPLDVEDARALWTADYADEPFIELFGEATPSLRDVVGTNAVAIAVWRVANVSAPALQVVVALDNLLKGAAGQALQNMNLMLGLDETEGLPWRGA